MVNQPIPLYKAHLDLNKMDHCVHPHHQGAPSSVPTSNSAHTHSQLMTEADQQVAGTNEIAYQSVASAPTAALVEMLSRIDALEAIPRLQVRLNNSRVLAYKN